jgi:hypothetical protein
MRWARPAKDTEIAAKSFFNAVFHNTVTITIFTEINDDKFWG